MPAHLNVKAIPDLLCYACENVKIDGIVIRDSNVWAVTPTNCEHLIISNIKLIGLWRYNADGIDIVNSQDVTIDKCFIRSFDDSIVIKGLQGGRRPIGDKPVKDVRVSDCVIWNDWGRALEIGAETVAPEISGIIFKNCDIIHTVHIAMDIQHGDRALIQDITFENIRFEIDDNTPLPKFQSSREEKYSITGNEGYCPRLIVLEIRANNYSNDKERGRIQNIVFKNISVTGKCLPESYFVGYDSEHQVKNIIIDNLRINGQLITNAEEGHFAIGDYVENVKFVENK
jgi:polygalacturonase